MKFGILSGSLWGLDTVILGIAFTIIPFLSSPHAALASAAIHDTIAALLLLAFMGVRRRLTDTYNAVKNHSGRAVMIAAILGGPVGMTGYLIAINHIGPGFTAIISTFYPAVGTFLAYLFLKERMSFKQIIALVVALCAIIAVGWSSSTTAEGSTLIGIIAALACLFGWGSEAVILGWGMRNEAVDNQTALHIRQTTSALTYLLVVIPLMGTLPFISHATFSWGTVVIGIAALAGTASYLFYYRAIDTIGASRAMAANISYSAWALLFAFIIFGTIPTAFQMICCVIILCGTTLAATSDWKTIIAPSRLNRSTHQS